MTQALVCGTPVRNDGLLRVPVSSKTITDATGDVTISPPASRIRVGATAGTLVVTYANKDTDTITVAANETIVGEFVAIDHASTAKPLTIFW